MANIEPQELIAQEEVKSSSSNNIYLVSLYKNCISCTCPAGGRKTLCKHMLGIIHKYFENLKETSPEFYENIVEVLELKSNNGSKDAIKQLTDKIIFVDRKTAETAFDNSKNIKINKIDEFTKFIDDIESKLNKQEQLFLRELYRTLDYSSKESSILITPMSELNLYEKYLKIDLFENMNIEEFNISSCLNCLFRNYKAISLKSMLFKELENNNIQFPEKKTIPVKQLLNIFANNYPDILSNILKNEVLCIKISKRSYPYRIRINSYLRHKFGENYESLYNFETGECTKDYYNTSDSLVQELLKKYGYLNESLRTGVKTNESINIEITMES